MTHAPASPTVQESLAPAARAEAARYALLRRLAPSMRHHLVVNLQPIGMIYEVMDRRLRAAEPDLAQVQASAHKIGGFARAALDSCLDVVTWLAPDEAAAVPLEAGVRECLGLLATSLGFRGYAVRDATGTLNPSVRRSAVRNVLTAALLHLTDEVPPPGELVISQRPHAAGVELLLSLQPVAGEPVLAGEPVYRLLGWEDLQALATAESAAVERPDPRSLSLVFPGAGPPRP